MGKLLLLVRLAKPRSTVFCFVYRNISVLFNESFVFEEMQPQLMYGVPRIEFDMFPRYGVVVDNEVNQKHVLLTRRVATIS